MAHAVAGTHVNLMPKWITSGDSSTEPEESNSDSETEKSLTPHAKRIIDQATRIIDQMLREAGVSHGHHPSEATARDGPR